MGDNDIWIVLLMSSLLWNLILVAVTAENPASQRWDGMEVDTEAGFSVLLWQLQDILFDFNPEHVCVLSCFSCIGSYGLWTILSMGSSRQEDWSGLPSPPPEDLPDPGIELVPLTSPALEAGSLPLTLPSLQVLVAQSCLTLCYLMDWSTRLLSPWEFPDKNTGVGCHSFLQGIFLTQGSDSLPSEPPGKSIQNIQKFEMTSNILLRPPSFLISGSWSFSSMDKVSSPGFFTNGLRIHSFPIGGSSGVGK